MAGIEKFSAKNSTNESGPHASPEDQFAHPEHIRVGEEDIDVYDILPEKRKTETATILAPGFSATPMAHEQNILGLAKAGRRVISANSPHGLAKHTVEHDIGHNFPEVELAKLSAVIEAMNERGIEQADVVAHSEGAIYMALAALLYPHRFRNMVFVDPAGMIGKDNIFRLVAGNVIERTKEGVKEMIRTDTDRYAPKLRSPLIPLRVLASNLKRTWESVKALHESDIIDMLKELKEQGIGISIVHGASDQIFPMKKMQKALRRNVVTGFYSVRGNHDEIFLRPEQYTNAVDAALDALEARNIAPH